MPIEPVAKRPKSLPAVTQKVNPALMKIRILNNCVVNHTAFSAGLIKEVPYNQGAEMVERGLAEEVDPRINLEGINKPATKESLSALSAEDLNKHLDTLDATDEVKTKIRGLSSKDEAVDAILQLRLPGKPNTAAPPPGPVDLDALKKKQLEEAKKDAEEDDGDDIDKMTIAELLEEAARRGADEEKVAELGKLRKAAVQAAVRAL